MSLIKIELTEKSGFTMEFSVSKEVYDKAEMAAYKKNVGKYNVPGFRKGKAPKAVIEKFYGKGFFFEDAINACIPEAFDSAVKEAGITVVGNPSFDLVSNDGDIVLKAEGFVKPEVSIEGYKGISAPRKVSRVLKADIEAEVDRARQRLARTVEVTDRAAKNGDIANIDFEGFVDGVAFEGGKGEGHDLKLGSGTFIPGFEAQIEGKKIGEEFDVNVTFPEAYSAKELAGKAANFKTKLNAIKTEELPAADDDFAKDVSEFDTLDEYKADIKAKLAKKNEENADKEFENAIIDTLISLLVAEIPEAMFAQETENFLRDYDSRLRMQGLDLNQYIKYTGMTLDTLRAQFRPNAEKQVKLRLALEKIASLEALTVSDDEIADEFKRIAEAYNLSEADVKAMVSEEDVKADMLVAAAMKFVKDNAVVKKAASKSKKTESATESEDQ